MSLRMHGSLGFFSSFPAPWVVNKTQKKQWFRWSSTAGNEVCKLVCVRHRLLFCLGVAAVNGLQRPYYLPAPAWAPTWYTCNTWYTWEIPAHNTHHITVLIVSTEVYSRTLSQAFPALPISRPCGLLIGCKAPFFVVLLSTCMSVYIISNNYNERRKTSWETASRLLRTVTAWGPNMTSSDFHRKRKWQHVRVWNYATANSVRDTPSHTP